MRSQTIAQACTAVLLSLALAACGGGVHLGNVNSSSGSSSSGSSSGSGGVATVKSLTLLVSSAQLPSAASGAAAGLTISAIAKDGNNNLVSGALVSFKASAGGIAPNNAGTTDNSGTATALLTTGGDPTNQIITITASSGSASSTLQVPEVGTSISISGPTVVGSGATASYTVTLTDSSSRGIPNNTVKLTSVLGNGIALDPKYSSPTTDANGQVVFTYTGTTGGNDTLTGSASTLNASNTTQLAVSATKLVFQSPAQNTNILFGTVQPVQVQYTQNGAPVANQTVNFSATRGTINGTTSSAGTAVTNSSGVASVTIQSGGAGGAGGSIIAAQITNGPSASESVQFVATTPSAISVQANPATIVPSGTSTITATVRDANDNLVAGQVVNFTLTDPSNGSLSAASGTTDQSGSVSVTYQATSSTSAQNGVKISATVNGTSVTTANPALITVGAVALRITLGTGNSLVELDATRNQLPYSVFVTDSAGNPPPNGTSFKLLVNPIGYQKGHFFLVTDPTTGVESWAQFKTVGSGDPDLDSTGFGCKNEDVNLNGVLDAGEDYNSNGKLDPDNAAIVPSSVTLDSSGSAQFFITYPKDHAYWEKYRLTAVASVAGTEATAYAQFVLTGLAKDYAITTSPPGQVSPYGVASTCANPN
jgi:hypothetical protein